MTAPANGREALVKRLGFEIDDMSILRWLDGGCQPATDAEIDMWDALLAAPTEAPVADGFLHDDGYFTWNDANRNLNREYKSNFAGWREPFYLNPPRQQDARSATEYADVPMGPVGATYIGDTLLPCPQSAPVSREAIIDEVAKGLDGKVFACHAHDDFGKGRERGLLDAAKYVRSLAAHPAEPAGKGE